MTESFDFNSVMADLTKYIGARSAYDKAYAIVCSPQMRPRLHQIIDEAGVQVAGSTSLIAPRHPPIFVHGWCDEETIYLPDSKEQLDKLMSFLSIKGLKLTGKVCIFPDCTDPAVESHGMDNGLRAGFCALHLNPATRFSHHIRKDQDQ